MRVPLSLTTHLIIDVWLMTEEGLLALSPELKNREANLSDEIDVS